MDGTKVLLDQLVKAVQDGGIENILKILAKGADVDAKTESGTPVLNVATENGNFEIAKALIEAGAAVNATDKYGLTPLISAAGALPAGPGHIAIVRLLLEKGVELNMRGKNDGVTALWWAEHNKNHEIAELLRNAGASK